MFGIGISIEKTDGYRFDLFLLKKFDDLSDFTDIQRNQHLTIGSDPFLDLQPEITGDKRRWPLVKRVIHIRPIATPDLQHIPETFSCEQGRLSPFALDQSIDDDRCTVNQK